MATFERVLGDWAWRLLGDRGEAIAVESDGVRGLHAEEVPGVRLVLAQVGVKAADREAELTAAPQGWRGCRWRGGC